MRGLSWSMDWIVDGTVALLAGRIVSVWSGFTVVRVLVGWMEVDEGGHRAHLERGLDSAWPVDIIRDHGHAHGSRRRELTNYLGENPGGNLGTAQVNPCCWLTPTGP